MLSFVQDSGIENAIDNTRYNVYTFN